MALAFRRVRAGMRPEQLRSRAAQARALAEGSETHHVRGAAARAGARQPALAAGRGGAAVAAGAEVVRRAPADQAGCEACGRPAEEGAAQKNHTQISAFSSELTASRVCLGKSYVDTLIYM